MFYNLIIFEIDGEEYIADTRSILTSNPPQYNCYNLKNGTLTYKFCSEVHSKAKREPSQEEIMFLKNKRPGYL